MRFQNKRLLNFLTLFSGTTASQAANFFFYIFLSRLYSESDFGFFSLFMSYVILTSVLTNPQIPLLSLSAKDEKQIDEVESLSESLLLYSVAGVFVFYVLFYLSGSGRLNEYLLFIPPAVLLYTLTENRKVFANQRERFRESNLLTIIPRTSGNLIKILLSKLIKGAGGLITGEVLGNLYPLAVKKMRLDLSLRDLLIKLNARKSFLFYNYPSTLVTVALNELLPFFMISLYSVETAGAFFLFDKFILQPFNLIGSAVGNSQSRYITGLNRSSKIKFFIKLTVISVLITIPVTFFIGIWGEWLLQVITKKQLFPQETLTILALFVPVRFFRGIIHVFHHVTLNWRWGLVTRVSQLGSLIAIFIYCSTLELGIKSFFLLLLVPEYLGEIVVITSALRRIERD
jgi:O-antigen/teichoic acid export membrane protein